MDLNQQNENTNSTEMTNETSNPPQKKLTGFAKLKIENPETFLRHCSNGGKAAHAVGKGYKFSPEQRLKGGYNSAKKRSTMKQQQNNAA